MNTDRISIAIKRQVGELHKLRHPQKNVVVDVPGFDAAVERRSILLKRLVEHKRNMPAILQKHKLVSSTRRRFGHIRNALDEGGSLMAVSLVTHNGEITGVEFHDGVDPLVVPIWDKLSIRVQLKRLKKLATDEFGYIVLHDMQNFREKLSIHDICLNRTIDLAFTTMVVTGKKKSSAETGLIVGINRSHFSSYAHYLFAVARAYVGLPDIMVLANNL